MVHQPQLARYGTRAALRQSADFLDRITGEIAQIIANRTKQPLATVQSWFDSPKDLYFTADEAVKAGLADEVYATPAGPSLDHFTGAAGPFDDGGKTEGERQFWRVMRKLGDFAVKDPDKFRRSAFAYITHHVRQG